MFNETAKLVKWAMLIKVHLYVFKLSKSETLFPTVSV